MNNYLVIYEPGEHNWSAFSPDVPGCVATGKTREQTERNFQEALTLHLEAIAEDNEEVPMPSGIVAGYVTVPATPIYQGSVGRRETAIVS